MASLLLYGYFTNTKRETNKEVPEGWKSSESKSLITSSEENRRHEVTAENSNPNQKFKESQTEIEGWEIKDQVPCDGNGKETSKVTELEVQRPEEDVLTEKKLIPAAMAGKINYDSQLDGKAGNERLICRTDSNISKRVDNYSIPKGRKSGYQNRMGIGTNKSFGELGDPVELSKPTAESKGKGGKDIPPDG